MPFEHPLLGSTKVFCISSFTKDQHQVDNRKAEPRDIRLPLTKSKSNTSKSNNNRQHKHVSKADEEAAEEEEEEKQEEEEKGRRRRRKQNEEKPREGEHAHHDAQDED